MSPPRETLLIPSLGHRVKQSSDFQGFESHSPLHHFKEGHKYLVEIEKEKESWGQKRALEHGRFWNTKMSAKDPSAPYLLLEKEFQG